MKDFHANCARRILTRSFLVFIASGLLCYILFFLNVAPILAKTPSPTPVLAKGSGEVSRDRIAMAEEEITIIEKFGVQSRFERAGKGPSKAENTSSPEPLCVLETL